MVPLLFVCTLEGKVLYSSSPLPSISLDLVLPLSEFWSSRSVIDNFYDISACGVSVRFYRRALYWPCARLVFAAILSEWLRLWKCEPEGAFRVVTALSFLARTAWRFCLVGSYSPKSENSSVTFLRDGMPPMSSSSSNRFARFFFSCFSAASIALKRTSRPNKFASVGFRNSFCSFGLNF